MTTVYNAAHTQGMRRLGKGKGPSPRIQLRLPADLYRALEALALKDRRDLIDYIRLALLDHVESRKKGR